MTTAQINQKLSQVTIGGDPEIFIQDGKGKVQSSIPILQKDKHDPIILDKKRNIKLYADNSLSEFAFAPGESKEEFIGRYRLAFQRGQEYLNQIGQKHRFLVQSAHTFEPNELEAAFGIDPMQVGCSPEFDFYKICTNDLGAFENSMRSGSSHIHVGHPDLTEFNLRHEALRTIEIFLGCASVIWDNDPTSLERRQKYGKAGSFRPTSYGFETRFMSNYMLNSPKLVGLAYDLIRHSLIHVFNGTHKDVIAAVNEEDVKNAINQCNKTLAEKVLKTAKLPKPLLQQTYKTPKKFNFNKEWAI